MPVNNIISVGHNSDAYDAAWEALGRLNVRLDPSSFALIKPNAGRCARSGDGVTTCPDVVKAVVEFLRERGAGRVAIGESPITGVKTMEAFEKTGIAEVARELGVELIDMDDSRPVDVDVPGGNAISSLKVCPQVLEADYVVSVPVMKTHMHTQVTLGVKNMKGCLWRRSKVKLHQLPPGPDGVKSLDLAIADLAGVLRPDLTVIDGTIGMEGLGPSAGTPRRADIVVAGADPVACDATAVRLMKLDPRNVPHLTLADERGVGRIEGVTVEPADYLGRSVKFEPPPENVSIEWPDVVVHQEGACSACVSTLLLFLKRYASQMADYQLDDNKTHLAIGKTNKQVPDGTICIGNCTVMHKESGVFIPGCPPVSSYILEMLEKARTEDE